MIDLHPSKCNLCGGKVALVNNELIYGRPFGSGKAYLCTKCGAYVGTHKGSPKTAMGILADARMRKCKQCCHELFDKHWKTQAQRSAAYKRLAAEMGIDVKDCHFGYFDLDNLKKAYRIISAWSNDDGQNSL